MKFHEQVFGLFSCHLQTPAWLVASQHLKLPQRLSLVSDPRTRKSRISPIQLASPNAPSIHIDTNKECLVTATANEREVGKIMVILYGGTSRSPKRCQSHHTLICQDLHYLPQSHSRLFATPTAPSWDGRPIWFPVRRKRPIDKDGRASLAVQIPFCPPILSWSFASPSFNLLSDQTFFLVFSLS